MMNKPAVDSPDDISEADRLAEGARSLVTQETAWQSWLAAVQFLTRIPVPADWLRGKEFRSAPALRQAVIYFPLVGALIGLTTGLVIWLTAHLWPLEVAVIIGLAIEALLTGAARRRLGGLLRRLWRRLDAGRRAADPR